MAVPSEGCPLFTKLANCIEKYIAMHFLTACATSNYHGILGMPQGLFVAGALSKFNPFLVCVSLQGYIANYGHLERWGMPVHVLVHVHACGNRCIATLNGRCCLDLWTDGLNLI